MTPDVLIDLFDVTATAIRVAVAAIDGDARRARTTRPGQYALDLVADDAALAVLREAPLRIVSEESGIGGEEDSAVTVVLDPVDGSTNCARGISYWATSLCALDDEGPLAALVVNQATGERTTAIRGRGAFRSGVRLHASRRTRIEDAVVAVSGVPARLLPWKQFRALGCAALALCDVAAGGLDGYLDGGEHSAPWDYLGGYLACIEAGASITDAEQHQLVTSSIDVRRQLVAAGTPELLRALLPAARAR